MYVRFTFHKFSAKVYPLPSHTIIPRVSFFPLFFRSPQQTAPAKNQLFHPLLFLLLLQESQRTFFSKGRGLGGGRRKMGFQGHRFREGGEESRGLCQGQGCRPLLSRRGGGSRRICCRSNFPLTSPFFFSFSDPDLEQPSFVLGGARAHPAPGRAVRAQRRHRHRQDRRVNKHKDINR